MPAVDALVLELRADNFSSVLVAEGRKTPVPYDEWRDFYRWKPEDRSAAPPPSEPA